MGLTYHVPSATAPAKDDQERLIVRASTLLMVAFAADQVVVALVAFDLDFLAAVAQAAVLASFDRAAADWGFVAAVDWGFAVLVAGSW